MQITWTSCAEQMPPNDYTEILIRPIDDNSGLILTPANECWYDVNDSDLSNWEWTEFTQEKWEELTK